MIRLALIALALCLPAGAAIGQVVALRSGEHGDFTRLAFDLSTPSDWTLEGTAEPRRFLLRFAEPMESVDTSQVFRRIDRARLDAVTWRADLNGFMLDLSCDCAPEEFLHNDRMLVLDIRPGAFDGPRTAEIDGLEAPRPGPPMMLPDPRLAAFSRVRFEPEPRIGVAASTPGLSASPQELLERQDAPALAAGDDGLPILSAIEAEVAAGRLTASIARPEPAGALARPGTDRQSTVATRDAEGSGIDRQERDGGITLSAAECASEDHLLRWDGATQSAPVNTFSARSAVYTDFDGIDAEAMLRYADALLSLGFGAEARALDRSRDFDLPRSRIALSHLVDAEPDPTGYFRGMTHCRNQSQIWAVLSHPSQAAASEIGASALLQSFELLPGPLRAHLGPDLSAALLDLGLPEVSRDILSRLRRGQNTEPTDLLLAASDIDTRTGAPDAAIARLDSVRTVSSEDLPRVLRARVDALFAAGQGLDTDTLEAITLLYEEDHDGPTVPATTLSYMRAALSGGAFAEARAILVDPGRPLEAFHTRGRSDFFDRLVEDAPDVVFLKEYLNAREEARSLLGAGQVLPLARRIADLGMEEEAHALLSESRVPETDPERRLIEARLLFAMDRLAEAEALLLTLRSPEAEGLRARIRAALGDFETASTSFERLGDRQGAVEASWLGGRWEALGEEAGVLSEAAALAASVRAETGLQPSAAPSLADMEALVSESEAARETLLSLLGATETE